MKTQEIKEITQTIINQLGGVNKLSMMIGAHMFTHKVNEDNTVSLNFRFKMCKNYNAVTITLTNDDLYNISFYKLTAKGINNQIVFNEVYSSNLKQLFIETTHLELSL